LNLCEVFSHHDFRSRLHYHRASPQRVYDFISQVENLSAWAAGVTAPMEFAPRNPYLVADHVVTLPEGSITVPLRVLPHPDGAEVVLIARDGEHEAVLQDFGAVEGGAGARGPRIFAKYRVASRIREKFGN